MFSHVKTKVGSNTGITGDGIYNVSDELDNQSLSKSERLKHQSESLERNAKDRVNARDMYNADATLQKWFALTFVVLYIIVIVIMILAITHFAIKKVDIPDWAIVFFTTIFTGISMKVATITDFLFGGSRTAEIQERKRRR